MPWSEKTYPLHDTGFFVHIPEENNMLVRVPKEWFFLLTDPDIHCGFHLAHMHYLRFFIRIGGFTRKE